MTSTMVEKSAEDLKKEIDDLNRQQREITEMLRDPRGVRRGGSAGNNNVRGGRGPGRSRGAIRTADRPVFEEPPAKKKLLSAVVKVEDAEKPDTEEKVVKKEPEPAEESEKNEKSQENGRHLNSQPFQGGLRREGRGGQMEQETQPAENVPRVVRKIEDPSLVKRNKRMLGQLLGTLEKFRQEDKQLSSSEAFMRRSDTLRRAEERAREESERLRQQEREQFAEKRRQNLTLRARLAAKTEEKKLDLLFLHWTEHHKKLNKFLRTKSEPVIFYAPKTPFEPCTTLLEEQEKDFLAWKANKREELSQYQKQVSEQILSNVESDLQKWQSTANSRNVNNAADLQESMDNDLETHKLTHGPKKRIPRGADEGEEDVEDVVEDDMLDDVLVNEETMVSRDEEAGADKVIVGYGSADE